MLVRQALRESPGIERVAGFGPPFPGNLLLPGLVYDAGLGEAAPAVEVYEVADPAPTAWTAPLSDAVVVAGGPDALLPLEERGLLTDRPTVLAGEAPAGVTTTVVSDALVRRERTFGRITDATSAGLAPDDPLRLDVPRPRLRRPVGGARGERRAVQRGCAERLELRLRSGRPPRRGPRGAALGRARR